MAIPSAPAAGSVILQTGNGQNQISWPIISGATSYVLQRSLDGVNWSALATITGVPLNNYYIDGAVSVGNSYYYQVAAFNISGLSAYTPSYPALITPCLPGQINLGYLRYMSQLRSDQLNSTFLTTDEWNFNVNQYACELYDILIRKFGDNYFFAVPLLIPLVGNTYYPLPDGSNYVGVNQGQQWIIQSGGAPAQALYKLSGVDANVSGSDIGINAGWIPLSRSNWSDRDRYTTWPGQAGALNNIYQMSYRQMGSNLWLFPQNMNMLIRLFYVPMLSQMLQDSDMMPFSISGWSEYVIIKTAKAAATKEESWDLVVALEKQEALLLDRIEATAANRDVDQPNTVSNVRSTMGDPGFSDWGNGFGAGGFGGSAGGY